MRNRPPHLLVIFAFFLFSITLSAQRLEGEASFYGDEFEGKNTSTGEPFRQTGYTAASKEFPWGTILEVTNLSNGRAVHVRVNDCGPHVKDRLIDLTRQAAKDLDFEKQGWTRVRLRVVRASNAGPTCARGAWSRKLKRAGQPVPPPPGAWQPGDTPGPVTAGATPRPAPARPAPAAPQAPTAGSVRAMASFYADRFNGRPTSTGEVYDATQLTAASKAYPYNTLLEVANAATGASVVVRVNDCGPHDPSRLLDLSKAAALQIGVARIGLAAVDVRVITEGQDGPTCNRTAWQVQQGSVPDIADGPATYGSDVAPAAPAAAPAAEAVAYDFPTAYQVQIGAFRNEASALQLARQVFAAGYLNADYVLDPAANLYVVRLHQFYDKQGGREMQQLLRKDGLPQSVLRERTTPGAVASTAIGKTTETSVAAQQKTAYVVELGTFTNPTSATAMARKALAAGYAETHLYRDPETGLHTVVLYPLYAKAAAEKEQLRLRADGFIQTVLRQRTTIGVLRGEGDRATDRPAPATYSGGGAEPLVTGYTLQMGAFRAAAAAEKLKDRLLAAGFADAGTYRNPATNLYTTILRSSFDKATAEAMQQKVVAAGFAAALKEVQTSSRGIVTELERTPEAPPATSTSTRLSPAPAPAPKTYDAGALLFGVQVGTYTSSAGARGVKERLAAVGMTEIYDAKVDKLIRVFAGKFYFQEDAEDLRDQLREAGFKDAAVRRVQ